MTLYRYPWYWPGSARSWWNIGFGSNATWTSGSDAATQALRNASWNFNDAGNAFDEPCWIATPGGNNTYVSCPAVNDGVFFSPAQNMYIPNNAAPSSGSDKQWSLFDENQPRRLWQMNNAVSWTQGSSTMSTGYDDIWDATGLIELAINGAYNKTAGVIRAWDLDNIINGNLTYIPHALRSGCDPSILQARATYYTNNMLWPNFAQDYFGGQGSYTGPCPYGSTFGIPAPPTGPTFSTSSGNYYITPPGGSLTQISQGAYAIGMTLQMYGATDTDIAGGGVVIQGDQDTDGTSQRISLWQDIFNSLNSGPTIRQYVRILTNQKQWTTTNGQYGQTVGYVNGGGTYSAPAPWPFDPALGIGTGDINQPVIRQFCYGRTSASSALSATFRWYPDTGNWLLFIIMGRDGTPTLVPSGLGQLLADSGVTVPNQGCFVYAWQVPAGNPAPLTYNFTMGFADYYNLAILELVGVGGIYVNYGACSGDGTSTITTGNISSAIDSNGIRFLGLEWDNNSVPNGNGTPPFFGLTSAYTWLSQYAGQGCTNWGSQSWTNGPYHNCILLQTNNAATGSLTFNMNQTTSRPVYLDVQVTSTTGTSGGGGGTSTEPVVNVVT